MYGHNFPQLLCNNRILKPDFPLLLAVMATPLQLAVLSHQDRVVKFMIEREVDINLVNHKVTA